MSSLVTGRSNPLPAVLGQRISPLCSLSEKKANRERREARLKRSQCVQSALLSAASALVTFMYHVMNTRCQLKKQRLYKAPPPPHQRKSAQFLSVTEQRALLFCFTSHREHRNSRVPVCKKTFIHFMTIKTIYSRNNMDINVVLCLSYVNVNYLEGGMLFNLCLIGYPMLFSFLNL